jgi:hypothetical protein
MISLVMLRSEVARMARIMESTQRSARGVLVALVRSWASGVRADASSTTRIGRHTGARC